jgi:hypothetical protein
MTKRKVLEGIGLHDMIISIVPAPITGHSYKLHLGVEPSRWGRENGIRRFKLITPKNGGSILLVPLRDSELEKELDTAKKRMGYE